MEQAMEKESWFDDQHRNFRRQQGRISWKTSKNDFWISEGLVWWQDHHLHRWIKIRNQSNRCRLGLHHQFQLLLMESLESRFKMRSFWCRTVCYQKSNRFCLWKNGYMDTRNLDFFWQLSCSEKTEKSRSQSWPILYQSSTNGNRKIVVEKWSDANQFIIDFWPYEHLWQWKSWWKSKIWFKIEDRLLWSNNFTKLFKKKSARMLLRWLAKRITKFKE